MENSFGEIENQFEESPLKMEAELSSVAREYLLEASKWAKFIAIVGFVFIGLIALIAIGIGVMGLLSSGSRMPNAESLQSPTEILGAFGRMSGFISIMYLMMAALYFFPTYYLFRFASRTKAAILSYDSDKLTDGLGNLKSMFKFMGILTAIVVGLYGFLILMSLGGGLFSLFM